MPANRQQIPREERRDEVISAAREIFVLQGYRSTSMLAVGRACGVTKAAVHWYFPSKDDLLAAVMTELFAEVRSQAVAPPVAGGAETKLVSYLTAAVPYRSLHREAYERMEHSDAVRAVLAAEVTWLEETFLEAIYDRLDGETVDPVTLDTARFLFEGILLSARRLDRPVADILTRMLDVLARAAREASGGVADA